MPGTLKVSGLGDQQQQHSIGWMGSDGERRIHKGTKGGQHIHWPNLEQLED